MSHMIEIESSFLHDGYRAQCQCGWEGPMRPTVLEASKDGDEHRNTKPAEAQVPSGKRGEG